MNFAFAFSLGVQNDRLGDEIRGQLSDKLNIERSVFGRENEIIDSILLTISIDAFALQLQDNFSILIQLEESWHIPNKF